MKKLTCSATTTLLTTSNALGTFDGTQFSNLQQGNLEPGEYTLQFNVIEPPIDGLGYATYAYVIWKVEGQPVPRIISVYNGAAISGVADSVDVHLLDQSGRGNGDLTVNFNVTNGVTSFTTTGQLFLKKGQQIQFGVQPGVIYTIPNGMAGTIGNLDRPFTGPTSTGASASSAFTLSEYKVGVTLSKGTRPTTMQPPVLLTTGTISEVVTSGHQLITLPPTEAGAISVMAVVATNSGNQTEALNGVIGFSDANGAPLARYAINQFSNWYPIPPGAVTAGVSNTSTTVKLDFSVQWGIEG